VITDYLITEEGNKLLAGPCCLCVNLLIPLFFVRFLLGFHNSVLLSHTIQSSYKIAEQALLVLFNVYVLFCNSYVDFLKCGIYPLIVCGISPGCSWGDALPSYMLYLMISMVETCEVKTNNPGNLKCFVIS
jgi:hypothetical protein